MHAGTPRRAIFVTVAALMTVSGCSRAAETPPAAVQPEPAAEATTSAAAHAGSIAGSVPSRPPADGNGPEDSAAAGLTNGADVADVADGWEVTVVYHDKIPSSVLPTPAQATPVADPLVPAAWWIPAQPAAEPSPLRHAAPLLSPRATEGVQEWTRWCVQTFGEGADAEAECAVLLDKIALAVDYLGADEACVLSQYRHRVAQMLSAWDGSGDLYGWHRCATVVAPDPGDTDSHLVHRCWQVLPADVELEPPPVWLYEAAYKGLSIIPVPESRVMDCVAWVWQVQAAAGGDLTLCSRVAVLAVQWMQHHHFAPVEQEFTLGC